MNLVLLHPEDFIDENCVRLRDERRVTHILKVHRARVGDQLTAGQINGKIGKGTIVSVENCSITMQVSLTDTPPAPSNISLILALPRPPMLKRILQTISTLGIKELTLIQSSRVDKSYWQTPQLQPEKVFHELVLGLEQARDTQLPNIHFERRFRPFVEDRLEQLLDSRRGYIAHPYSNAGCPHAVVEPCVLAIGPEGGFLDQEVADFEERGFCGVTLGERILRVETAVTYLLGRFSKH